MNSSRGSICLSHLSKPEKCNHLGEWNFIVEVDWNEWNDWNELYLLKFYTRNGLKSTSFTAIKPNLDVLCTSLG